MLPLPTPIDVVAQRTSIESAITLWKDFDLDGKRASFDAQATEIGNNKEISVKARKVLAKQTQDFKKTSDEEKLQNLGALLKLYQEEVDRLTRRSKSAETSFLNLYKSICEVQDPVPILEMALSQAQQLRLLAEAEEENKKMQAEQAEFAKELQGIKNQEVTVRKLEDKIKEYEARQEEIVEERCAGIAKKLREDHSLEMDMLKERVSELQSQLATSHAEQSRSSNGLETTQSRLFDLQVQYDKLHASRQAEVDLITSDLERAQSLVATLERENEVLRNRSKEGGPQESRYKGIDLELEIAHKEIEVARLTEQIQILSTTLSQERENNSVTIERLNNELKIQNARYDQLAAEAAALPSQQTYDAVVQELEVLKSVYGAEDGKGKGTASLSHSSGLNSSGGHHTSSSSSGKMSVEQALRDKARQLESESMKLKMYLGERESEVATLRERVGQLEGQVTEYQSLVEKLEDDLAKQSTTPSSPKLSHPNTSQMAGIPTQANAGFPPPPGTSHSDMLEIVCGQRDRFKIRLGEMEQENDRVQKQLEIARTELNSLRQDNVKLYEKIRYLQSYTSSSSSSSARGGGHDLEKGKHGGGLGDELEGKYGKLYEDTVVNPFAIFNRKERYRRYRELNTAERVIFNTSQFFLSTKGARLFLFFYSVLLHLLVMLTLYKLSVASYYQPNCAYPPTINT